MLSTSKLQVFALGFLISSLYSCAFGTRNVTLNYPPEEPAIAEAAPVTANGKSLVLIQFVDQRSNKKVIGEVRNGYGMHTADVVCENDVAEWVTGAIKMELEKRGYKVIVAQNNNRASGDPTLGGEILQVYCTALWNYEGEVSFFAQLQKDGKELFRKRYTGKGSAGLNWSASSSSYGGSLSRALSVAAKNLVDDVSATMRENNLQ
jgi:hypothetical protein